ncbi:MAG TPA: hypothetical protein VIL71_00940 [Spirillospora sp.]
MKKRVLSHAVGGAFIAFGLVGVVREPAVDVVGWAVWFGGAVLVHDAFLAPCVLLIGAAVARLPGFFRTYVQVAAVVSASVSLVALPFVLGKGRRADNPSILPSPYGRNLLLVVGTVLVLTALLMACVALWRRHGVRPLRRGSGRNR